MLIKYSTVRRISISQIKEDAIKGCTIHTMRFTKNSHAIDVFATPKGENINKLVLDMLDRK